MPRPHRPETPETRPGTTGSAKGQVTILSVENVGETYEFIAMMRRAGFDIPPLMLVSSKKGQPL